MTSSPSHLNVADVIGPILRKVSAEERPLLISLAERMAAKRYREWAGQLSDQSMKISLLACADREEEVARRVESLFQNANTRQKELLSRVPELLESGNALFTSLPLKEQFAMQAEGERAGGATWRSYATRTDNTKIGDLYLECALLEEQNAACLDALIASPALSGAST